MKQGDSHTILKRLIFGNSNSGRLRAALAAVGTGMVLLLLSVTVWWNFDEILSGRRDDDSLGSTFLTVSKKVTDDNMGKPNATVFTDADITAIKQTTQVQDVGALVSNRFPVYAVMNRSVGFATELFLEAVQDDFMDKRPETWSWKEGDRFVPIIVSSEFLNLYNYGFALSQGLPQISESTIKSISFDLKVGGSLNGITYQAQVVGFSDRISSVLVPESFINYGNKLFAGTTHFPPSRLIVKVKDPSDRQFVQYLEERDYITNAEQLRWNKLRALVDTVAGALGVLSMLILGIGILVIVLFIELTITRAQQSIKLLYEIGYSPRYLSRFMLRQLYPRLIGMLVLVLLIAIAAQWAASYYGKLLKLSLAPLPGWPVWLAMAACTVTLLLFVSKAVYKTVKKV